MDGRLGEAARIFTVVAAGVLHRSASSAQEYLEPIAEHLKHREEMRARLHGHGVTVPLERAR